MSTQDDIQILDELPESTVSRTPWSTEEDEQLCHSWLETSIDSVVGTDQTSNGLWNGIHKHYHNNKTIDTDRTVTALSMHWGTINPLVAKFYACYKQIQALKPSGVSALGMVIFLFLLYMFIIFLNVLESPGRKSGGPGHFWSLVVVQSSDFTTTARTLEVEEKMVVQALNYRTGIGRSGTNGRPNLHDG